jgi:hypothetical protein
MAEFEDEAYGSDLEDDWEALMEKEEEEAKAEAAAVAEADAKKSKPKKVRRIEEEDAPEGVELTDDARAAQGDMQSMAQDRHAASELLGGASKKSLSEVKPTDLASCKEFGRLVGEQVRSHQDTPNYHHLVSIVMKTTLSAQVGADLINTMNSKIQVAASQNKQNRTTSKSKKEDQAVVQQYDGGFADVADRGGAAGENEHDFM